MMIIKIEQGDYNRKLEMSDWRFSAAALGMIRFFRKCDIKYNVDNDILQYNSEYIEGREADKKYFQFVEWHYNEDMHHIRLKQLLEKEKLNDEEIKEVNAKLVANAVMKKIFKGIKYSEETKKTILNLIEENRLDIIKETYRYMLSGYRKYANTNLMRKEAGDISRLSGYSVDKNRKTRAISYNFNAANYNGKDAVEFDFIPFAFTKGAESIFINNNYTIETLLDANNTIDSEIYNNYDQDRPKDIRELLFLTLQKGTQFIDYDVEVIIKDRDEEYYKTLFVRKEAIRIFKRIDRIDASKTNIDGDYRFYHIFNFPCRLANGEYIQVMKTVCEHIINYVILDNFIDMLLKDGENQNKNSSDANKFKNSHKNLLDALIRVNQVIYKGGDMENPKMKATYVTAKEVVRSIYRECGSGEIDSGKTNNKKRAEKADLKLRSYRQKLISCLVFKNYERFIEIVLQLSAYSQVSMGFLSDLAENFEENKNLAYVFTNNLENFRVDKEEGEK